MTTFQRRKRPNEPGDSDRLTELPDSLIIQILSLLEMKDSVKTETLSKKWKHKHLWTQVYNIVYDIWDFPRGNDTPMRLIISFIDRTLMKCTCPNIEKFSLTGFYGDEIIKEKFVHELVDKWIGFVLRLNVKFLDLQLEDFGYSAPDCLYNSSSIVKLDVNEVEICVSAPVKWNSLKTLCLQRVEVEDVWMENMLLGCPVLERLVLDDVRGLNYVNIRSRSVKKLVIMNIDYQGDEEEDTLIVTAPYVEKLRITGCFLVPQIKLVDVSSLKSATLDLEYALGTGDVDELLNGNDYNLWWIDKVIELLNAVCEVDNLTLESQVIQALSVYDLWDKPYPVFKCKCLTVRSPLTEFDIYGIACILQKAPCLETLYMVVTEWQSLSILFYTRVMFNSKDLPIKLPKGDLIRLKHVKVNYVRNFCTNRTFRELHEDDQMFEYILQNATAFVKLVILTSAHECKECFLVCASKYVRRLSELLTETFLENHQYFKWELKTIKTGLEFSFPDFRPLLESFGENAEKQIICSELQEKKMPNQPGNSDILSELPEPLIIQILSLLDMKDVVKTCVLSKRWKHLWTKVYIIVFDFDDSLRPDDHIDQDDFEKNDKEFEKKMAEFISFIDHALMQCVCPSIERFSLRGFGGKFSDDKPLHKLVDKWVAFVLKQNIKFLNLEFDALEYSAPDCLFNNSSLINLEVDEVEICIYSPVKWTLLKTLCLKCIGLPDTSMENILLGCPALETLVLVYIYDLNYINIMSRSVKRLELHNMEYRDDEGEFLKITAPYIQTLEIGGAFLIPQFKLIDVSSLEMASLKFEYPANSDDFYRLSTGYNYNLWWINMVMELLKALHAVDNLTVNSQIIQALSVYKLWDKPSPVFKCKCLTIWSPLSEYDIYGIACLLQTAPDLETLYIKATDWKYDDILYYAYALLYGEELYLHSKLPRGDILHLKNVEVDYIRDWCENHTFYELHVDYLIFEYILKNATVLEKLVILTSAQQCDECLLVCASKYTHRLFSSLLGTFLEDINHQDFEWKLKTIKSGFEFSFPKFSPLTDIFYLMNPL